MNWLKLFKKLQVQAIEALKQQTSHYSSVPSAQIAKERLKIIIAHQNESENPDFETIFPEFQEEIVNSIREILKKHYANNLSLKKLSEADIHTQFQQDSDQAVLEINITVPELTAAP